jgi:nucleotide sugar dehydrogenase
VVAVQGLGFVGAAVAAVVAAALDRKGRPLYNVVGVDLPTPAGYWKVAKLSRGETPFVSPDPELPRLIKAAVREHGNLHASASEEAYALADYIIVDIPLDVLDTERTDPEGIRINRSAFEQAVRSVGRHMKKEALVLIETTVPVGATEHIALPILLAERARRGIKSRPMLAHAYERVMPGPRYISSIRDFWRTYSGGDARSAARARDFLASFIRTDKHPLAQLRDTRSSELAKLLENSYRAANIAFIHEWTLAAEKLGINLFAVVDSIRVRKGTHDNMRYPGFGVGGYCLTKDSLLAQWSLTSLYRTRLTLPTTLRAIATNRRMPLHTFDLLCELLPGLKGRRVAVLGLSYLPEVPDTRNTPTEVLFERLCAAGARVELHDPTLSRWPEHPETVLSPGLARALRRADAVVLAVPHRAYRRLSARRWLAMVGRPFALVDAQNVLTDLKARWLHARGCRLLGVGKGHWRASGYHLPTPEPGT